MTTQEFAKKNAGRKATFKSADGKLYIGYLVGYGIGSPSISSRVVMTGHPNGVDKRFDDDTFGGFGVSVVPDREKYPKDYGWITPADLTFIDNATDEFLRDVFAPEAKPAPKKKVIAPFPHVCPNCKGPAYVGFNTTVDCERKCSSKIS